MPSYSDDLITAGTDYEGYTKNATSCDVSISKTHTGQLDIIGSVSYVAQLEKLWENTWTWDSVDSHSGSFNNGLTFPLYFTHADNYYGTYRVRIWVEYRSNKHGSRYYSFILGDFYFG